MGAYRDFDAARAEHQPLAFRLAGRDFTTVAPIPAGPVLDLGRAQGQGGEVAFDVFVAFFEAIIPEDQAGEFAAAIREVGFETMRELLAWIVEEATGRPLPSASSSESSSPENGQPSRRVSLTALA